MASGSALLRALQPIFKIDAVVTTRCCNFPLVNAGIDLETFFKLRNELPVIDVRSEGEFAEGHIPGAHNIPILTNDDRVAVGTRYKKEGQHQAIMEGFHRVGPRLEQIIKDSLAFAPEFIVHCWRGGMRSGNFASFVSMAGIKTHLLKGGYKTWRTHVLNQFEQPFNFLQIGGCTGSGKTELLWELKKAGAQVLDLEGLANHKGSAFGHLGLPPQPTTEQFQNELFEALTKLDPAKPIWIEDESFAIGKVFLPDSFWRTMTKSPLIELVVPEEVRIDRLVHEYGAAPAEEFKACILQISKKLGGLNTKLAIEALEQNQMAEAISLLLFYYDRTYTQGLIKRTSRIVHRVESSQPSYGTLALELMEWSKSNNLF